MKGFLAQRHDFLGPGCDPLVLGGGFFALTSDFLTGRYGFLGPTTDFLFPGHGVLDLDHHFLAPRNETRVLKIDLLAPSINGKEPGRPSNIPIFPIFFKLLTNHPFNTIILPTNLLPTILLQDSLIGLFPF